MAAGYHLADEQDGIADCGAHTLSPATGQVVAVLGVRAAWRDVQGISEQVV